MSTPPKVVGPGGLTVRRFQRRRQGIMCDMRRDGLTIRQIARKLRLAEATVSHGIRAHCQRNALPLPNTGKRQFPSDFPLTLAEERVLNAIAGALNGLSAADLLQELYPDGDEPATAVDCVRSCVSRVRRKQANRLDIPCICGRYYVRTRMAEAAE